MKRIISVIAALSVIFLSCGCGAATEKEDDRETEIDGSIVLEGRYEITGEAELGGYTPNQMALAGDKLKILGSVSEPVYDADGVYIGDEFDYRLFSADAATMEMTYIPLGFEPEGYCSACGFDGEGGLLMVEGIYKDRKTSFAVDLVSPEGELIRRRSLDELIRTGFRNCVCFCSGIWYVSSGRDVVALDGSGEVTGKYDLTDDIMGIFAAGGALHAYTLNSHYVLGSSGFAESAEWKRATEGAGDQDIVVGGCYDYLRKDTEFITGFTLEGGEKPLLNWLNSDLSPQNVSRFLCFSEDVMYLCVFGGFDNYETRVVRVERREGYSIPASNVITMYYAEDGYKIVPIAAAGFNASQSDYRVICHEVSGGGVSAEEKLNLMLVSGSAGDIIEMTPETDVQSYIGKGVFLDLYGLGLSKSELFGCVTTLGETEGRLYFLPLHFNIRTLVGSADFHPGGSGWTVGEFIEEYKAAESAGVYLTPNDGRESVLSYLKTGLLMGCVDFENNGCSFGDPSFIGTAKWLQGLPENRSLQGGMVRSAQSFIDGTVKLDNKTLWMPQDCFTAFSLRGSFGSGSVVGYPTPDGGKSLITCGRYYGINSSCRNPEAAMSFLRYMLGGRALTAYYSMGTFGFPSLKSMLGDVMEYIRGYEYQIDPANLPSISGSSAGIAERDRQDDMIYISIDDGTILYVMDFVDGIEPLPGLPAQLTDIFDEELSALFGGRSAEDVAKNLQSRISLWLAERE
ncbi:MAG: hypothetical protein K6D94_07515 [Clostridiales bacterium]|nr:hypothetical protein [Clostridiales bacterium]